MKIMTFNTQHCQSFISREIDYEIMAKTIRDANADIVGLNEMRDTLEHFSYDKQTEKLSTLTKLYNNCFAKAIEVHTDMHYAYGNGFISKDNILSCETTPIALPKEQQTSQYYETRSLMKAKLECGLTVIVTHFGLTRREQELAVKTVLENLEDERCVLMGDFNIRPDSELLLPIRERMKDTESYAKSPSLTFPSDAPDRKIDYIFVSRDIEVVNAGAVNVIASDHLPYMAEILF